MDPATAGRSHGGLELRTGVVARHGSADAQKNERKPWLKKQWCIPPEANAEFVYKMEDGLEVYQRPYDPGRPQICLDEASRPLIGETRWPVAAVPGREAREDYEYVRNGTVNLFMMFEPLAGRRHVRVTDRRTKKDFAEVIKELADERYPDAEKIVLVMDNLNTHSPASLYEAFEPSEARRLVEKLEIHDTPKHGSWLNMAECELSVLEKQALGARVGDETELRSHVTNWGADRNHRCRRIDWQFRTPDARIKLRRLYPQIRLN